MFYMKRVVILVSTLTLVITGFGQVSPTAQKYAATITEADLRETLSIIASDAMEGRETGKRGQKMAAAFIAAYFEDLGLKAPVSESYYQSVPLFSTGAPTVSLNGLEREEFVFFGSGQTEGVVNIPLVFAGSGSDAEMAKLDVTGKAVAVLQDANASVMNNPTLAKFREKGAKAFVAVIEKKEDFARMSGMFRRFSNDRLALKKPEASGNFSGSFLITAETAGKLFNTSFEKLKQAATSKKLGKIKPATIDYSITRSVKEIRSENVLGFLEGTDKKDEVVVITAHYDHEGVSASGEGDRIYNGADDDGSGTVAVLEIAQAFVQAKKDGNAPRRSILFMTVTGEEKGLLGSEYYSEHPIYPLDKTIVDLNIDMIGRRDPQHKNSEPYVYVIGSDRLSSELHTLSESINKTYSNLIFDYTYNAENHPDRIYYRSDHWNFAKKNIPIIFYFNGVHEDYHKPSDEVDKIEFDLLMKRTKNIFHVAWEIANRESRLVVDKGEKK